MAKTRLIIIYGLKLDPPVRGEPSNPLGKIYHNIMFYNRGRKFLAVEFLISFIVSMISVYFSIPTNTMSHYHYNHFLYLTKSSFSLCSTKRGHE